MIACARCDAIGPCTCSARARARNLSAVAPTTTPSHEPRTWPMIVHLGDGRWGSLCDLCGDLLEGLSVGSVASAHARHVTRSHNSAPDPRLERAKALTAHLAAYGNAVEERRRLLTELRSEGMSMSAMAAALGIARQRLYAIVGTTKEGSET